MAPKRKGLTLPKRKARTQPEGERRQRVRTLPEEERQQEVRAQHEEERPQEAPRPRVEQDLGHVVENLTNLIREQTRMHNEQMEQMKLMLERNHNLQ